MNGARRAAAGTALTDDEGLAPLARRAIGRALADPAHMAGEQRAGGVDVMVMDLSMGDQGGVEALVAIKARVPDLPVLILSALPEAHYATALLQQGASGYLGKDCEHENIVEAIRTV